MSKMQIIYRLFDDIDNQFYEFCDKLDRFIEKWDKKVDERFNRAKSIQYSILDETGRLEEKNKGEINLKIKGIKEKYL